MNAYSEAVVVEAVEIEAPVIQTPLTIKEETTMLKYTMNDVSKLTDMTVAKQGSIKAAIAAITVYGRTISGMAKKGIEGAKRGLPIMTAVWKKLTTMARAAVIAITVVTPVVAETITVESVARELSESTCPMTYKGSDIEAPVKAPVSIPKPTPTICIPIVKEAPVVAPVAPPVATIVVAPVIVKLDDVMAIEYTVLRTEKHGDKSFTMAGLRIVDCITEVVSKPVAEEVSIF